MGQLKIPVIVVVAMLLFATGCGDDNNLTDSEKDLSQASYKLYAVTYGGVLSVIDIPADTLVDEVSLGFGPGQVTINSNFSKLVFPTSPVAVCRVFNIATLQPDTMLTWPAKFVHFDRRRGLGLAVTDDCLIKFDGATFAELSRMDIPPLHRGQLDTINGVYYSSVDDAGRADIVYRIDYLDMSVLDSIQLRDTSGNGFNWVGDLLPIPQHERLYFYGDGGINIYDLDQEQTIRQFRSGNSVGGQFVLSSDREKVYASEPGNPNTGNPMPGPTLIFGAAADSIVDSLPRPGTPLTQMRLTPDGKYLYGWHEVGVLFLHRYDLGSGQLTTLPPLHIDPSGPSSDYSFEIAE